MKILFVSINNEHSNTTYVNLIRGLTEVCDLTFFGPGYSTKNELERGLYNFCKDKTFDAVILSFFFAKYRSEYMNIRYLFGEHRYLCSDFSIHDAIRYADEIVADIDRVDVVKALLYVDDLFYVYDWWNDNIRELLNRGYYFIAPGEQFLPVIDKKDLDAHRCGANTRYAQLINDYRDRIISMIVYAVGSDEFYWAPLEDREYDWVVPGNTDESMYSQRKQILDQLNNTNYKVYDKFIDRELPYRKGQNRIENSKYILLSDRLTDMQLKTNSPYLNARVSREKIAMWRENYRTSLRSSKIGYADGSFARCIVKKYFEIPAYGALLVCDELSPLNALGFIDGVNMISINERKIKEISDHLFSNPEYMQEIASSGRELVFNKHTSRKRAEGIVKAMQAICDGIYICSFWENGDFIVQTTA